MALLSAAVAILLGTALVLLIVAVTGQRDAGRTAFRSQQALTAGTQLESSLISIENGLRGYVASGRGRFLEPATQAIHGYPAQLRRLTALVSADPVQQAQVRRIASGIDDYLALWAHPLIALARERPASARSVIVTNAGRQRVDAIRARFGRLFARERIVTRVREERAEQRSALAIGVGVGGLGLVLVVAAGLGLYLRRTVVRPVLAVADATGRVADGDLGARVGVRRADEIGDLARGFNAMAAALEASREELAARTGELERSNHELEQFASVTSHDLQAPLVTITMYAELLERHHGDALDAPSTELIDGIRTATQQARALIRDLLEYSRAGRGRLDAEELLADDIVENALEALAGTIEETGATVVVDRMPVVLANRASICRVLQNLIGNAMKFTAPGRAPEVRVGATRDGSFWRLWVRDNGIGMEEEHVERIFQPFQRLHGEEAYPGTGIGLAVCERIVTQHGGRIWARSRPGEGSEFSFTLPAVGPASALDAPAPVGAAAA